MISLENITFSYGKEPFLKVDRAVFEDGCLTAILGENGSGKTTLLKLINGIEKPRGGDITVDGKKLFSLSERERARLISYFPQSRPIPDMTAFETVLLGRYPYGFRASREDEAAAHRCLAESGAEELASRNMMTLSYGERQRVYLAMLKAQDTRNCIFDEPSSYMDASAAFGLMDSLKAYCREGRCVVCVLHDVTLAMSYADKIMIMKKGRVTDMGTPCEIYERRSIDTAFGIRLERIISGGKEIYLPLPKEK